MLKIQNSSSLSVLSVLSFIYLSIPLAQGTNWHYVTLLLFFGALILHNRSIKVSLTSFVDRIPLYFLATWVVGVFGGILRNNATADIFSNFAGMIIYVLYIALWDNKKLSYSKLYKIIYVAAVVVSIELIISYLLYSRGISVPWPLKNIRYNRWTKSVVSGLAVLPYVLESISLWNLLHRTDKRSKVLDLCLLIISTISIVSTTDSGGALLGYVAIFGTVLFLAPSTNRHSKKYWFFSVLVFIIILFFAVIIERRLGIVKDVFSVSSSGNSKRYYQFQLVFERFKIFGNGLGSRMKYSVINSAGSIREIDSYGLEVSYLNLIDKFGLLAFPLMYFFAYTYLKPVGMLIKGKGNNDYSVLIIGLLGYMFVALGNPVLFSPYNVVLHIIALLFLKTNCNLSENKGDKSIGDQV